MAVSAILPEYPSPPGNKNWVAITKVGPSSYTAISIATPPTGGQTLTATDHGLIDLDAVTVIGASDNGQYGVRVIFPNNPATPSKTVILQWFVLATGAEVSGATNLSGRTVRLLLLGH